MARERNQKNPILAAKQLLFTREVEDVFISLGSTQISQYANTLKNNLEEIHRKFLKEKELIDHVHFEYHSLVLEMHPDISENIKHVRHIFVTKDIPKAPSLLEEFAKEVKTYEESKDILPPSKYEFCSIIFCPSRLIDVDKIVENGCYPIYSEGIKILANALIKCNLFPWRIEKESELQNIFIAFKKVQSDITDKWEKRWSSDELAPNIEEIFRFALNASITNMQIVSNELFDAHAAYEPAQENAWVPGKRPGVLSKKELDGLRNRMLHSFNKSRDNLPQRTLTFIPIRLPRIKDNSNRDTIGLVAYYSADPLELCDIMDIAIIDRIIFLTCRQFELYRLQEFLASEMGTLKMQRIFSRLMAHEATKPLGMVKGFLKSINNALDDSENMLGKFARGEFGELQQAEKFDLYDLHTTVKERYAQRIDDDNILYEDNIHRNSFVFADWDAVRHTLGVLIYNAIIHGMRRIRVWIEEENQYMCVFVANNGLPMPQEVEEAIKAGKPYVRRLGEVRESSDLGAGLYLAFEFAKLNEWELKYKSQDNDPDGFRHVFSLRLPKP